MLKIKIVSALLLISLMLTLAPHPARAGAWGEDIYASIMKQKLEEMYTMIKETVVANLKIAAIRIIQTRLNSLIGGSGMGGPRFVTDWRDDIYGSAQRNSDIVVNNYFQNLRSQTLGSQGQQIVSAGERMHYTDYATLTPDLDKYMRAGSSQSPDAFWRLWLARAEIQNQPFVYDMVASGIGAAEYAQKAGTETAKNIAYRGVEGVEEKTQPKLVPGAVTATSSSGGKYTQIYSNNSTAEKKITMPGSIVGDIWAEVQNMPTKMLTFASSIPEIASSMVSQMISQTIQQGVTNINSQIDNQLNNAIGQSGLPIGQIQGFIQSGGKNIPSLPNMPSIPKIPTIPTIPK